MGYRQSTHDITMHYAQLQHYTLCQLKYNLIYTTNHFTILKDNLRCTQIQIVLQFGWKEVAKDIFSSAICRF